MTGQRDHWRELCIAAAFEDNPEKLTGLVAEINQLVVQRQEDLTDRIFEKLSREPLPRPVDKAWIQ